MRILLSTGAIVATNNLTALRISDARPGFIIQTSVNQHLVGYQDMAKLLEYIFTFCHHRGDDH